MSSPDSLIDGVIAAFVGIFFSVILFFAAALPTEKFVATMEQGDYYNIAGGWGGSYNDVVYFMNLLYIIVCLPALVGVLVLFLSAIRTQKYDVIDGGEEAEPQYVSARELYRSE